MPCLFVFLTITIAMGINPGHLVGTFLQLFRTKSEMLKWFVLELLSNKLFYGTVLEQFLMPALEKF